MTARRLEPSVTTGRTQRLGRRDVDQPALARPSHDADRTIGLDQLGEQRDDGEMVHGRGAGCSDGWMRQRRGTGMPGQTGYSVSGQAAEPYAPPRPRRACSGFPAAAVPRIGPPPVGSIIAMPVDADDAGSGIDIEHVDIAHERDQAFLPAPVVDPQYVVGGRLDQAAHLPEAHLVAVDHL